MHHLMSLTCVFILSGICAAAPQAPKQGVLFNGETSYAVVEDGKPFDLDVFTVAAWVKTPAPTRVQIMLGRGAAGELFTLYLYANNVRMLVEYAPGKYTHATGPLPDRNRWTHYAGSYDGQTIKLYRNGEVVGKQAAKGRMPASSAPLYLGALAPEERNLNGQLEDVRIWSRVLSDEEVAQVAAGQSGGPPDGGLVGRWTCQTLDGQTWANAVAAAPAARYVAEAVPVVLKDDGYRGIWYCNQGQKDEYVYKYSGGLGTYCSSHNPFAVYRPEVQKTFFCYGGTVKGKIELLHMVSYFDHRTGMVPRPTVVMNKRTNDAHDNPVISMDTQGHIWIFSSSHGTSRPSTIWVSKKPYDIDDFERVLVTNFSYTQPWYLPGHGFLFLQTLYREGRRLHFQTSPDGRTWTEPVLYAAIDKGHYQVSWCNKKKVACAFNYHPSPNGLNWRTNLYCLQTDDFGRTWRNAQGQAVEIPLTEVRNPALVHEYESEGRKVYVQDLNFDSAGRPVILYTTSGGWESGPINDPRIWQTAYWNGREWEIRGTIRSDNNYDMGSIYIERDDLWRIIGPTEPGPQVYNTSGEIAMWTSTDRGATWKKVRQMTANSQYNHGYCRRPIDAHPDFYAIWADGHGREPSESRIYFCDRDGNVFRLPQTMTTDFAKPEPVPVKP